MNNDSLGFSPFVVGTMRLGDWGEKFTAYQWQSFVEECLSMGLNDFDHADIYGGYTTEADFGQIFDNKSSLRSQLQITTKCGIKMPAANRPKNQIKSYDSSPDHIIASVEQSLKNLKTDYIDLLLLHRPDFLMHPEHIASTFESLKQSGKVLHFGVSNFSTSQFEMLNSFFPLKNHQIEASIFHLDPFENGQMDQLITKKIQATAWSPLGGGLKMRERSNGQLNLVINALSKKYQINTGQLLLSWLLKHPAKIIPVLGTSKLMRIKEAMAINELTLESEDWYALYSASKGEILP